MKTKFLFTLLLVPFVNFSQGIISTPTNDLITVTTGGVSNPDLPNVGVSVAAPTANLDVEGLPGATGLSNIRFRNLPLSNESLVLVSNNVGYLSLRPAGTFGSGNAWLLGGNLNGSLQTIGTNDAFDFPFVTAGTQRMNLTTTGTLEVGNNPGALSGMSFATGAGNVLDVNGNSNLVYGWGNNITATSACIVGGQNNTALSASGGMISKSVALGWANTLQDHNQYLIGAANSASSSEYCGAFGVGLNVDQSGSWYIGGNSGTFLTNNTTNSLAIGWAGSHTALFNGEGLTLGTATGATTGAIDDATARLDVNGMAYAARPSGVRFRDLPQQKGNVLVLDQMGYVYDSGIDIQTLFNVNPGKALDVNTELLDQVNDLARRVEELNQQLAALSGETGVSGMTQNEMKLFPNPSTGDFLVRHYIPKTASDSKLVITALNGERILEQAVSCVGVCNSHIQLADKLAKGTYSCTLIIDGEAVSTETFIVH